MKYLIGTLATAVLLIVSTTCRAENNIPTSALNEMGLSGLTVMSDSEAMSVRGQGAFAGGISWAIGPSGPGSFSFGSINVYGAHGKYYASGAGGSIAGRIRISSKEVEFPGGAEIEVTTIRATAVFAGGFSTARAF